MKTTILAILLIMLVSGLVFADHYLGTPKKLAVRSDLTRLRDTWNTIRISPRNS